MTNRHATAAEARFNYDQYAPLDQKMRSDYADLITRVTAGDADATIKYASIIRGVENYKKKILGEIAGAQAIDLNGRKFTQEAAYRAWIKADPARTKLYGQAAVALDALVAEDQQASLDALSLGTIGRAQLLGAARTAYRFAKERAKPDALRESGYQDRDRLPITERLRQIDRRYTQRVDRAIFEAALASYAKVPAAQRNTVFEAKVKEIGLDALYADTKLADATMRLALLDQSAAAIEASSDPFLKLAVALYPGDIAREALTKDRAGRTQAARSAYMRGALAFAQSEGRSLYPDANGSLRFTYGHVKGRAKDGVVWTPFTTAEGLLAKQTGRGDFNAPANVVAALRAKDWGKFAAPELKTLPINYLSTVDITNGNSGSSTLNAKGEFVGLAFDGTLDGVISDWSFDATINRTIHADSRYMLWSMAKVDDAQRLLSEMGVK